jgi:hypothetical protein
MRISEKQSRKEQGQCDAVHIWRRQGGASSTGKIQAPLGLRQRRNSRRNAMKIVLAVVALGTVLAAPAFAQQAPTARQDWSSRVHVYAPDYYAPRHDSRTPNPDYQLGGGER